MLRISLIDIHMDWFFSRSHIHNRKMAGFSLSDSVIFNDVDPKRGIIHYNYAQLHTSVFCSCKCSSIAAIRFSFFVSIISKYIYC